MSENTTPRTLSRRQQNRIIVVGTIAAAVAIFNLGANIAPGEVARSVLGMVVGALLSVIGVLLVRPVTDSPARQLGWTVVALGAITVAAHTAGLIEALI